MDTRAKYWPGGWRALYQQLQAASAAGAPRLRELLDARAPWLLAGPCKFERPSAAARKEAQDAFKAGKLVLGAPSGDKAGGAAGGGAGGGQRMTLEPRMEHAALGLSTILVRPRRPHGRRRAGGPPPPALPRCWLQQPCRDAPPQARPQPPPPRRSLERTSVCGTRALHSKGLALPTR